MKHFVIYEIATGRVLETHSCSQARDIAHHLLPGGHAILPADLHHHPDTIQVIDGVVRERTADPATMAVAQTEAEFHAFRRQVRERYRASDDLMEPDRWQRLSDQQRLSIADYRYALRACLGAEILCSKDLPA